MRPNPPGFATGVQDVRRSAGTIWHQARALFRLVQVRLRIPAVLIFAALVVGRWDVIRNNWQRLARHSWFETTPPNAISSDTEYFCPMDPGILSDWPGKCGICNMALVRRKRGEAIALPDGVVARMQLSPYRIQLAGIETAPAEFRPLERDLESSGTVTRTGDSATALLELPARQAPWVAEGQLADVACTDLPGHERFAGHAAKIVRATAGGWEHFRATIAIDDPARELRPGMAVAVRLRAPVAGLEPFRSLPGEPPALAADEPRRVYVCPDHADSIARQRGRCPIDEIEREARTLAGHQRLRYGCPMHPTVTSERPGSTCGACGGMELRPRIVSFHPRGCVLAVPQSAVVDAGTRRVVFVESMPGMFDGVEVVLGPRCGDYYPVVRGLEAGQKIAIAGAFLLDAETRLNPSLAASYFGAGRGERTAVSRPDGSPTVAEGRASALLGLSLADRKLAEQQKYCPVTGKPLGSMGTPARLVVSGRIIFLCCEGCEGKIKEEPAKYLAKLSGTRSP
jgi:hypothetical protein